MFRLRCCGVSQSVTAKSQRRTTPLEDPNQANFGNQSHQRDRHRNSASRHKGALAALHRYQKLWVRERREVGGARADGCEGSVLLSEKEGRPNHRSTGSHQHERLRDTLKLSKDFVVHSLSTTLTRIGEAGSTLSLIMRIVGHRSITVSEGWRARRSEQTESASQAAGKKTIGPLAQRLVQRTHNPLVVGSNPTGPTRLIPFGRANSLCCARLPVREPGCRGRSGH